MDKYAINRLLSVLIAINLICFLWLIIAICIYGKKRKFSSFFGYKYDDEWYEYTAPWAKIRNILFFLVNGIALFITISYLIANFLNR